MNINEAHIGTATYAMQKAMEMPKFLLDLVQNFASNDQQTLAMKSLMPVDVSALTGKGQRIDLVL